MNELMLIRRARKHADAVAFREGNRESKFSDLLIRSAAIARELLVRSDANGDLNESRVAFRLQGGAEYVSVQWAIWRAGGIAVPLSLSAKEPELEYALRDSQVSLIVTTREQAESNSSLCTRLGIRQVILDDIVPGEGGLTLPGIAPSRRAMILYTSGTTSRPKGVVTTHANIQSQIESLVEAWGWRGDDRIPLFLPMHHIHGIINVVSCALWSGASIEPLPGFQVDHVLDRVSDQAYTVFMAVPTIYVKLIEALKSLSPEDRQAVTDGFASMRLMVSGSAALPATVHQTWTELTGQKLLERYGMTEIGMALSNPYVGERLPGRVGMPLPKVEVRLKGDDGKIVDQDGVAGEIQVRGPSVFLEYWNEPEVTSQSFDDGWFRTGDIADRDGGSYRIMGRSSVDIIKSGGYKLSALEIEAALLDHPAIAECAVVGLEDETWGEAVAAAVVLNQGCTLELPDLKSWCHDRLSKYKIPKRLQVVTRLPRNAMGKVTKPEVVKALRDPSIV